MNEFHDTDLNMFKAEEKNILREMRGSCTRGHGPMVRKLVDKLNSVQMLIERYETTTVKEVKKPVAVKKTVTKK